MLGVGRIDCYRVYLDVVRGRGVKQSVRVGYLDAYHVFPDVVRV